MKSDSQDDDQTSEVGGDHDSKVMISTMDKMKGEVKELLAKGNAEAKTKAKIKKLKSILQLLEDNKDEDDSDEPNLEMAKEGQWKKFEDEAACKKIKENECKEKDEVKAEIESKKKKEKQISLKKKGLHVKSRRKSYQREGQNNTNEGKKFRGRH